MINSEEILPGVLRIPHHSSSQDGSKGITSI